MPAICRVDAQGRLRATSRWPTDSVRSAWCLVRDPNDPWRRMFVARRTNFCREPDGLAYRLNDRGVVAWEATSRINPIDPLGQWSASELFVQETLKASDLPASTVFRMGAELGFTPKVLRAASKRLEVTTTRVGYSGKGHWSWSLPGVRTEERDAERGNEECMGTFGNLCRIPGETPIAAAEVVGTGVAVADSREPSGWERDHAEARRLRRKARRQRKKERRQARLHAG